MNKKKLKRIYTVFMFTAILIVPVILLFFFPVSGSVSGIRTYGTDEYLKAMDKEELPELFVNTGGRYDIACVLRYTEEGDIGFPASAYYAVYVPGAGDSSAIGLETSGPVFRRYLKLNLDSGGQSGNSVFCLTFHSDKEMDFRVYLNGKKIDTAIMDVAFNPVLFFE